MVEPSQSERSQPWVLPPFYAIGSGTDGHLQALYKAEQKRSYLLLGDSWHQPEDIQQVISACWKHFYTHRLEQRNKHVATCYEYAWGYELPDGTMRHASCMDHHYEPTRELTYIASGLHLLTARCTLCDIPLLLPQLVEELFYEVSPNTVEEKQVVKEYAEQTRNLAQVDGFRAGYARYAEVRKMARQTYGRWLGYVGSQLTAYLRGYADGFLCSSQQK